MKGLFIPEITAEMFRNGCLESIEALMAEGEIYDIDYSPWIPVSERLPEEEHEVYCQLSDGSNAVLYVQDNWGQMEWVDGMMGTGTYDVVAWMEKPEPYKKGGE